MTDERPDWAYDGADVYKRQSRWNGLDVVWPRTVQRATATQLVVTDADGREERYRLKDLRLLGSDKVRLVSPEDPAVHATRRDREVKEAMADLWEVLTHLGKGAMIHRSDLDTALENATLIRDASVKAVEDLKQIL